MREKKYNSKDQIRIVFPPTISRESVKLWTSFKRDYTDYLILLMEEGLYFTLGIDALVIHQITGCPLHRGDYFVCYFHRNTWMRYLSWWPKPASGWLFVTLQIFRKTTFLTKIKQEVFLFIGAVSNFII